MYGFPIPAVVLEKGIERFHCTGLINCGRTAAYAWLAWRIIPHEASEKIIKLAFGLSFSIDNAYRNAGFQCEPAASSSPEHGEPAANDDGYWLCPLKQGPTGNGRALQGPDKGKTDEPFPGLASLPYSEDSCADGTICWVRLTPRNGTAKEFPVQFFYHGAARVPNRYTRKDLFIHGEHNERLLCRRR
jgi:hypothetical protein